MSRVLADMGCEYGERAWIDVSRCFEEEAEIIPEIANIIVAYLTNQGDKTEELPELFTKVLNIMTSGFVILEG